MGNGKWLGPALLLELWSSNTSSELCRPQRLGFPYLGTWGPSGGTRHRSHPTDRPRPMHTRCSNPFYFLVLLAASPLFSVSPLPLTRSSFAFLMPCWLFFCSPSPRAARRGQVAAVPGRMMPWDEEPTNPASKSAPGTVGYPQPGTSPHFGSCPLWPWDFFFFWSLELPRVGSSAPQPAGIAARPRLPAAAARTRPPTAPGGASF